MCWKLLPRLPAATDGPSGTGMPAGQVHAVAHACCHAAVAMALHAAGQRRELTAHHLSPSLAPPLVCRSCWWRRWWICSSRWPAASAAGARLWSRSSSS